MLLQYVTCMVDFNVACYLHDACYCSVSLVWWMLLQYVTCMVDVIAVCYLHDACYCIMLLSWLMLISMLFA